MDNEPSEDIVRTTPDKVRQMGLGDDIGGLIKIVMSGEDGLSPEMLRLVSKLQEPQQPKARWMGKAWVNCCEIVEEEVPILASSEQ